jgi:CRP/FNR family transcriptional regulator, anaerobic regulatory protein
MSDAEVAFMLRFKKGERRVPAGGRVLVAGESVPHLYTVLSGLGLRHRSLPDGRRQVLNFVFPGDLLGLQGGLTAEQRHAVIASTDMVLCVFDRDDLWGMFRDQPARALAVTWAAATDESLMAEALTAVGQGAAGERIAWALTRLVARFSALGIGDGDSVPIPWRQQDLADALGLSLVHTNKTLARFREQGLVRWTEGRLILGDLDALAGIAGLDPPPHPRPLI